LVVLAPLVVIALALGVRFYLESQIEPLDDEVAGDGSFLEEVQKRNRTARQHSDGSWHLYDGTGREYPFPQRQPFDSSPDPFASEYEPARDDPFGDDPPREDKGHASSDDPFQ
jgi:hypothetical protein